MIIWDIEGTHELLPLRTSYLEGASGFLLVVDGTRRQTLDGALEIREQLKESFSSTPLVMLVLNKADLSDRWKIHDSEIESLLAQRLHVIKGSAKTGGGVEGAFLALAAEMLET